MYRSHHAFSTSRQIQSSKDSPSIDVAYMPRFEPSINPQSEVHRVPLLPTNSAVSARFDEDPVSVTRPEIATVSATGTHIDSPSAMSEVTDNHAIELSPFDLTGQVNNAAAAAASKMADVKAEIAHEQSIVQEFLSGLLDDVLGEKKMAKT